MKIGLGAGKFLMAFLVIWPAGCVTSSADQPAAGISGASVPVKKFAQTEVKQHNNIYFSGQPDDTAFKAAADVGVGLVINLREKVEFKGNDPMLAKQAGLSYLNIPVSGRGPFDRDSFDKISAAVAQAKSPVWVYCSSGNRAAAWYVSHLILKQAVDQDEALEIGRKTGMTRPELEDRVLDYVNQH